MTTEETLIWRVRESVGTNAMNHPGFENDVLALCMLAEGALEDKRRMDFLGEIACDADVVGGAEDGTEGRYWGVGSFDPSATLRQTLDMVMEQAESENKG